MPYSDGGEEEQEFQTFFVRALYDYEAQDASSLSFVEGDIIEVLTQLPSGWWDGLLGDARGWFPSNYVEAIDEEEAFGPQMLHLDREDDEEDYDDDQPTTAFNGSHRPIQTGLEPALSLLTSTYPVDGDFSANLGLTQNFESLRELMAHDHMGGDGFEKLAEAAMLDGGAGGLSRAGESSGSRIAHIDAHRGSDIDLGSLHSVGTASSAANSIPSPSTFSRQNGSVGPSSMSADKTFQSKPRAATAFQSQISREVNQLLLRDRAASDVPLSHTVRSSKESEYWEPKMLEGGQIVYYNPRTGRETVEMPEGGSTADYSNEDDDDDELMSPIGRTVPADEGSYFADLQRNGKPGLLTSNISSPSAGHIAPAQPLAMLEDDIMTAELQGMLQPAEHMSLGQMLHIALECMVGFVDVCEETVDCYGFSEADRRSAEEQPSLLEKGGIRFASVRARLIASIRILMYSAGSLSVSRTDLLTIAEMTSLASASTDRNSSARSAATAIGEGNQGALAAFAGAVLAMHSKSNDEYQYFVPPASVQTVAAQIISSLAKLVMSSKAVTEQAPFVPPSAATAEGGDVVVTEESAALQRKHTAKLNSYRQRADEDAHELALHLEAFGNELDKHRALNGQPSWARRPFGALKSANGAAGVSSQSLSGGSGAGWRGSGFVQPSVDEMAALRLQSMNHFKNPFDLTRDAQNLILSGKANLKRSPGQVLREEFLQERIAPQLKQVTSMLLSIMDLIRTRVEGTSVTGLATSLGALAFEEVARTEEEEDEDRLGLAPAMAQDIVSKVGQLLARFGAFVAIFEDIDFASVLDVDGPTPDSNNDKAVSLARSAKVSLHNLTGLRESCYDSSTELAMNAQEISGVTSGLPIDVQTIRRMFDTLDKLKQASNGLVDTAFELARIANHQARDSFSSATLSRHNNSIGARGRIYGVEEAINHPGRLFPGQTEAGAGPASRLPRRFAGRDDEAAEQVQRSPADGDEDDDMMYLGPGVAVPNGPSDSQRGARDRAGSGPAVASTAAGSSSLSKKKGGSRWQSTQTESGGVGNDDPPARGGGTTKLKRFFGDEDVPPLQQRPTTAQNEPPPPAPKRIADEIPWYLGPDYVPEDIVISPEGQVKGATLHALIARLTTHNTFDSPFTNTFLLTYRSFTTTEDLMNLLLARFRLLAPEGLSTEQHAEWVTKKQMPVRLRVCSVLKSWLESYAYDGEDDRHLDRVRNFAEEAQYHGMELSAKQLRILLDRRTGGESHQIRKMILPESAPNPVLPKTRNIKFLDIDALEMGRQLALMDHALYCKIKSSECLGKAWSNADSERTAAGIKETISTSNQITGWVAESILVQQDLKKRAAWLKHFIAIADACRSLNNFSTMTAIVSGLNSAPIFRLKRTWDALNQRFIVMLESMNKIMASSKNFADYREMIHHLQPPCVPFLGVYLTDLTFIEDGNPDRLKDDRLINFGKRQKTAEVIREIMIYQATPYNLSPVPGVQRFISANLIVARSDNELYEQSLKLEPREREDEKISRLLAESGFL